MLSNTTDKLVNYEMRRKMRKVGVQLQHIGTQLCWQVYLDSPGRELSLAELVHVAKPEDTSTWSFLENIKEAVRLAMEDKARSAYQHVAAHLHSPPTRRDRAVYRREIVREYNGNREFVWNTNRRDWEISPTTRPLLQAGAPNGRLTYPNDVLGTTIRYWTGKGSNIAFDFPIAFEESQYGPGL